MSTYLELFRLSKSFAAASAQPPVVDGFDLRIERGEFVAIVGHSGCGKSTVLAMVAGLVAPSGGGVVLDGREIDGPGPDRGVVFQSPSLLPWLTAFENVSLGVDRVYPHGTRAQRDAIATHYLARLGLAHSLDKPPRELSQGERQRVGIARALALKPKVLLLDEPFGMLDALTRLELQEVLLDVWGRERTTALMVTHDVDEALFLADRIVLMTKGPRARVGEILTTGFARPRVRAEVLEHPEYDRLRLRMLAFLAEQEAYAGEQRSAA
ncbi:MAG: ABC transporter ATP-binding protein [Myxococcota bacterium]